MSEEREEAGPFAALRMTTKKDKCKDNDNCNSRFLRNDKTEEQRQERIRGSLHCGGKSAAFGRDDSVWGVAGEIQRSFPFGFAQGQDEGGCNSSWLAGQVLSGVGG